MANYRKELISDLKYVWDNYLEKIDGLKLVLCGSATAFMVEKVLRSKALYSRSINEIPLAALTLSETAEYLSEYSAEQVCEAYLLFGGIPEYLRYIKRYETALSALRQEGFAPGGYFLTEYHRLFLSSLSRHEVHEKIIAAFNKQNFYTQNQFIKALKVKSGGSLSGKIKDLELIGLIDKVCPFNSQSKRYYLRDPYLNLYLKIIKPEEKKIKNRDYIDNLKEPIDFQRMRQYLSYSFERFCRNNHKVLAKLLGFGGVDYKHGPALFDPKSTRGYQVDLVFDRKDRCLTFVEVKNQLAPLSSSIIPEMEAKIAKIDIPSSYNSQRVLVTLGPVSKELKNSSYFSKIIMANDLLV